jgi:hypothetical protein
VQTWMGPQLSRSVAVLGSAKERPRCQVCRWQGRLELDIIARTASSDAAALADRDVVGVRASNDVPAAAAAGETRSARHVFAWGAH